MFEQLNRQEHMKLEANRVQNREVGKDGYKNGNK